MPSSSSFNIILEKLYAQYVERDDVLLLNLVFAKNPTQELLESTMQSYDINTLGMHKILLLSYLMHDNPHLIMPNNIAPRLKGLIKYFRFANLKTIANFVRIGTELNKTNISMLLLKGGAIKCLRPALSRPMGDIDILVHEKDLKVAVKIGENMGYEANHEPHSVDLLLNGKHAVDIHNAVFTKHKCKDSFYRDLFLRAKPIKAFGVDVFLPCHEDLYFLALTNLTKNLREHSSLKSIFYTLCDCKFLLQDATHFDWNIVHENAKNTHKELELYFATRFINRIVADTIPREGISSLGKQQSEDFYDQIIFDEKYFRDIQFQCQQIRVVELKSKPKKFGKIILKGLFLKKIRQYPMLVRYYLNKYGR